MSVWSLNQAPPRELHVLVDRDTVADTSIVLELLLREDGIRVHQYMDGGPPSDAATSPNDFMPPTAIGWVTVGPAGDGVSALSNRILRTATDTVVSESSLLDSVPGYLRLALDSADASHVSDESVLLFAVARELEVDLLITAREDLLASPLVGTRIQIRTATAAVPVVALYLRGTDAGVIAISPSLTETVTPTLYYYLGVVDEYLPLVEAIEDRLQSDGRTTDVELARSVRRKLGFAFMRRDMVWRLVLQHPTVALLEELAAEVDSFLLFLTSALDAVARLLDSVLGLKTHRTKIGFQNEEWRLRIASQCNIRFDEHHMNAVSAITGLRNFTHGTGTRTVPIDVGRFEWKKTTTYVLYEPSDDNSVKRTWRDPVDAFWALRYSPFYTPSVDVWRIRDATDVFITPGPMCDVLAGGGIANLKIAVDALASTLGAEPPGAAQGLRIKRHIRAEQVRTFMAIPGFGDVEFLSP